MPFSLKERKEMLEKEFSGELSEREVMHRAVMKENDFPTTQLPLNNLRRLKKELRREARESRKKVAKLKEERSTEYNTSKGTQEIISKTFQDIELISKAHTFDEWCHECGCIHLDDVLGGGGHHGQVKKEERTLYTCDSCKRIPELDEVNGFFTEDEVVKFKLRWEGSAIEWGREMVLCTGCNRFIKETGQDRSVLLDPEWKLW